MSLGYLAPLDGLRALAIILVMLYHNTPNHNSDLGIESLIFKISDLGWSGVDLFFVLSGFLITRILVDYKQREFRLHAFYWNRFLRISPVYLLVITAVIVILPSVLNYAYPNLKTIFAYYFYYSNLIDVDVTYSAYFTLGHFWSLAVEMQFYLFFPLLVFNLKKRQVVILIILMWLIFMISRSIAVYSSVSPAFTFSFTLFRTDGLLLGALLAFLIDQIFPRFQRIILVIFILSSIYLFEVIWHHKASYIFKSGSSFTFDRMLTPTVVNIFYAILLIYSLKISIVSKLLSSAFLRFIAKYSYGIYIYHFLFAPIMMQTLYPIIASHFGYENNSAYIYFVVTSIFSVLISIASYELFESYFHKKKMRY